MRGAPSDQFRLMIAHAILSTGDGLWLCIWAIFITSSLGFSPQEMGYVVSVGGICGMIASYPVGALADKYDSKKVAASLSFVRAISILVLMYSTSIYQLAVSALLVFGSQSALGGIKATMVFSIYPNRSNQINLLSKMRVIQHVCNAIGMVIGSYFLSVNVWSSYALAISGIAITQIIYGALVIFQPNDRPVLSEVGIYTNVANDYYYILCMMITGLFAFCWPLFSTAMPLWIKTIDSVPNYMTSVLMAFSAIGIALFQIMVSSHVNSLSRASRVGLIAGCLLSVGSAMFGFSKTDNTALSLILLILGTAWVTAGEIAFIASRWVLSVELMAIQSAKGRYQGIVSVSEGIVLSFGPLAMVSVVNNGLFGWLALAGLFLLAGISTPVAVHICCGNRTAFLEKLRRNG